MAEPRQCFDERRFTYYPLDQVRRLELWGGNEEPPALLAAGKALPRFKLEEDRYFPRFLMAIAVPADAYFVLPEFARG